MTEKITDQLIDDTTKVLAKAKLFDQRVVANEATILAWAEVLEPTRLTLDDMLPAVVLHYTASTDRIMPADVIRLGRERRRDRSERSDDARKQLEALADSKAMPDAQVDELAARRRTAIAQAAASIGRSHHPDTADTFVTAPPQPSIESQATIAAKVARVRAAYPPAPMSGEL